MSELMSPVTYATDPKRILLTFSFPGRPESVEQVLSPTQASIKFPYVSDQPVSVVITALFPDGDESKLEASFRRVWGAEVQQESPMRAFVKMQHGPDGTCTVRCPRTGEGLTGVNPCLLCPTPSGDILELCC